MNHYVAAGLLLAAAFIIPILWVAVGLPHNGKNWRGWWW